MAHPAPCIRRRDLHTQRQNAAHCSTHYTLLALQLQARKGIGCCTCSWRCVWDFFRTQRFFAAFAGHGGGGASWCFSVPAHAKKQTNKEVPLLHCCKGFFVAALFLFFCTIPGYGGSRTPPPQGPRAHSFLVVDRGPGVLGWSPVRVGPDGLGATLWRHRISPARDIFLP